MGFLNNGWLTVNASKKKKKSYFKYTLLHHVKVHSNAFMFQSDKITHSSFKHWDILQISSL